MNSISIKKIAEVTRKELEDFTRPRFPSDWCGACAICSWQLTRVLKKFGYNAEFVVGEFIEYNYPADHAFVIVDNKIIDITATQFGLQKIVIRNIKNRKYKPLKKGNAALYNLRHWCNSQKPSTHRKTLDKAYRKTLDKLRNMDKYA